MLFDSGGLEILSREECCVLLDTAPLGRIVFTHAALPAVQPVNFTMVGDDIVIRTSEGSKLAAAVRNSVVAFEIDDYDAENRQGWSVVVIGHARRVSDPDELTVLRGMPLRPWTAASRDDFIRIAPEIVTGRRIRASIVE